MAASHSPCFMTEYAASSADVELQSDSSINIEGPLAFNQYEMRFANIVLLPL